MLGPNSVSAAAVQEDAPWSSFLTVKVLTVSAKHNYEPQLFLGFATDYRFAGWTLRDVEIGYNHDSNGRSNPTSRSWNRLYTGLIAEKTVTGWWK
ncbi:phospholipase A [Shigella flexneri]